MHIDMTKLTEEHINAAHREAVCQSGPRKGKLKSKCPPMGTLAAAYWQGAMLVMNPFKVSVGQMIFFTPEQDLLFRIAKEETEKLLARKRAA